MAGFYCFLHSDRRDKARYTLSMSRESIVFVVGIMLFFTPQIGIPNDWKLYIYMTMGVVLMLVGYTLRRREWLRRVEREDGERASDSFSESEPKRSTAMSGVAPEGTYE